MNEQDTEQEQDWYEVREQTRGLLLCQVGDRVRDQGWKQASNRVNDRVRIKVWVQVHAQVRSQVLRRARNRVNDK